MTAQTIPDAASYRQILNQIVETLPVERLGQIIDYARFLQTQSVNESPPSDKNGETASQAIGDPLDQEVQFFEAQHDELVKTYLGQYIAMLDGQVIASHAELEALIRDVRKTHPEATVLYRQVEETLPPTIVFRSPRLEQI